jgi:LemA protein
MYVAGFILLALLAIALGYALFAYRRLARLNHDTAKAWSGIEDLLKQRHEEAQRLVETCKGSMRYEKDILERILRTLAEIAAAREARNLRALGQAEGHLKRAMKQLSAAANAHPDLKLSQSYRGLEADVADLAKAIAERGARYNEHADIHNIRLEAFPDGLIARLCAFKPFDLLEFAEEEQQEKILAELLGG